jgi:DNA-binding response OmpR family regulator
MMGRTRETDAVTNGRGPIAIIGDSHVNTAHLSDILQSEGFTTLVWLLTRGDNGDSSAVRPVAVVLDWVPPGGAGIETCRQLRRGDPIIPILFVGGPEAEQSINRGLDAGADDFLLRPLRPGELGARLEAGLRKAAAHLAALSQLTALGQLTDGDEQQVPRLSFGPVEVDLVAHDVFVRGKSISLGHLEFRLLEYLCRNPGMAVSQAQILDAVYGFDADVETARVGLLVRRLRAKLGPGSDAGGQIVAVPGYGYRLERRHLGFVGDA